MRIHHSPDRARRAARRLREEGVEPEFRHDWTHSSGTLHEMPAERSNAELIEAADKAVQHAQSVRKAHARKSKRGSKQRETDINIAVERIRTAMRPIRRKIARLPYGSSSMVAEDLRGASQGLQRERRKLWKMKKHDK